MYELRALHYVFKASQRKPTIDYLIHTLGMTVLRHEEFSEGCKASCNGEFDTRWSKTMIGYGNEDKNFVLEMVFNYGLNSYKHGTDFKSITIDTTNPDSVAPVFDYDMQVNHAAKENSIKKIHLYCSNLQKSLTFWKDFLSLEVTSNENSFSFKTEHIEYEFTQLSDTQVVKEESAGRTAFSAPGKFLKPIWEKAKPLGFVHTDLVSLDTPGKATVEVVILADPDGHEVCIVGDEAFRELSVQDPDGLKLYERFANKEQNIIKN